MKVDIHHSNRPIACPYRKQQLESNHPEKLTKPHSFGYSQACALLQAIELNRRQRLSRKCLARLALFVSQAWEDKLCPEKIQQLYYMMNNLLDTTSMDTSEPFETALQKFCQNPVSTPTICPSVTLLIAISYVERLNKRYRDLKGTPGCGSRMIMVAFIMASKYIHDSLKLIIYISNRKPIIYNNNSNTNNKKIETPITPPTSPKKIPANFNNNSNSANTTIQSIAVALGNSNDISNSTASTANLTEKSSQPAQPIIPTPVSSPNPNPEASIDNDTTTTTCTAEASVNTNPTTTTMTPDKERNLRIARMEQEFMFFLNYDLSVQDPSLLVRWAHTYQVPENDPEKNAEEEYTSADDADDEMDDEEE